MNDTPVVGLYEAGILLCDGKTVKLENAAARIFRKGMQPTDVEPGTELTPFLL